MFFRHVSPIYLHQNPSKNFRIQDLGRNHQHPSASPPQKKQHQDTIGMLQLGESRMTDAGLDLIEELQTRFQLAQQIQLRLARNVVRFMGGLEGNQGRRNTMFGG